MRHLRQGRESRASLIDSLSNFIYKLNHEVNFLVVVEGPRDARALRSSGFRGDIFMLCHRQNSQKLEQRARDYGKIILLLDNDAEGEKLVKKAHRLLAGKVKIDLSYRRQLLPASKGEIRHVEELQGFAEQIRLGNHTHVPTTSTSSAIEKGFPM